jgi:hypothetical protein
MFEPNETKSHRERERERERELFDDFMKWI